jgi:ribonuclease HI
MLILQFDGLFRGVSRNSNRGDCAGVMCYGWVILRDQQVIARGHGGYVRGKEASSNVAEYLALIEGLEALLDMGAEKEAVMISGDAKSIIDQMQGLATVNAHSIRPLYRRARKLFAHFRRAYWCWTPRAGNQEADALTRRALRQLIANPGYEQALAALQPEHGKPSSRLTPVLDLRLFQSI